MGMKLKLGFLLFFYYFIGAYLTVFILGYYFPMLNDVAKVMISILVGTFFALFLGYKYGEKV